MGIDGDGQLTLGLVLTDDVLVEVLDDMAGGHGGLWRKVEKRIAARLPAWMGMVSIHLVGDHAWIMPVTCFASIP